ncbi:DUF4399 domain-containing protein [Rhodovulum sulfidophilum]|uniref:DUF4399 domain-containing protein n=1 Tax=Rhodovulum sulfidophilum TaxID=35806 RepID=UPI001921BFF0|nr:DUF4399 domain-containing protein [Rhodovulum sulfidophilum]MBL3575578.1 DUF4399 domain-containing protein [Rhodovulum sulfidophilum]MCE8429918.1 DUF4399 domain-containing protein [Rhodovulum sulfidophilum]MCF4118262.1 DUF4399 domain-containing protein [Rhodovulum sulfidophilum]
MQARSAASFAVPSLAFAALTALALPALAEDLRTPSPEGARVFIISPEDGATVSSPVTVVFGIEGMEVVPAGTDTPASGHHHLIVDLPQDEVDVAHAIPADDHHIHFGGGQTETTLELAPGTHNLWLLLGDANHVPHDPPVMSESIEVTVE